jgi:hypothetical protein
MKKFCMAALLAAWLVAVAGVCLAQAPVPSLSIPNTEVYGGFVVTSPDYGGTWGSHLLHGFEGGVSKALSERLWITGAVDFVWGNPSNPGPSGPIGLDVKQFSGTVGPKFFFLTGKFRPYATGQIGYSRQSSNGMYAADHNPPVPTPLPPGTRLVESGFTYRFGGGAEWQLTRRMYWRIVQWDFQPQPWGRSTPFYQNVGSGIGYRF